ncbi:MAG: hypothetical protein NWR83_07780 [Salibacteraceae bacterium]|nr:hypothetical protein [Salibacteraceae bacterium]
MIAFCLGTFSGLTQKPHAKLDQEKWEDLKETVEYSEKIEKKELEEPDDFDDTTDTAPTRSNTNLPDLSGLGYILIAIVILALILAIIFLVKQSNKTASVAVKRKQATSIEEAEDDLPDVELTDLFQDQVKKGEWRLALRVKFLMILQDLIDQNHIVWLKRKTNQQFVTEIKDTSIRITFSMLTGTFDHVWYGEETLNEVQFSATIAELDKLHNKLNEGK